MAAAWRSVLDTSAQNDFLVSPTNIIAGNFMLRTYRGNFIKESYLIWMMKNFMPKNFWFLFSLGLLFLVMYPAIFYGDYLYHDDLGFFSKTCTYTPWLSILGRPLADSIVCFEVKTFPLVGTSLMRDSTILILIFTQILIYAFLRRERFPDYMSVFMSFGAVVLPGMMVYVSWFCAQYIIFALILSITSAFLCQQIIKLKNKSIAACFLLTLAVIAEVAADLIHQNGGMFYLVFFAVAIAQVFYQRSSSLRKSMIVYGAVFVCANLGYFIYFKLKIAGVLAQQDATRGVLFYHSIDRLAWFFHYSLPRAINLWFNVASSSWSMVSCLISIVFIGSLSIFLSSFIHEKKNQQAMLKSTLYVVFLFALMLGCYLPTLVANMYLDFFRALVPLSAFFFLMICTHLWAVLGQKEKVIKMILMPLMILIAFTSSQAMLNQMVMPKYWEFQYYKNMVQKIQHEHMEGFPIHVVRPEKMPENNGLNTDEIGSISSTFEGHGIFLIDHWRNQFNMPQVALADTRESQIFDPMGKIVFDFSGLGGGKLKSDLMKMPQEIVLYPRIKILKLTATSQLGNYGPKDLFIAGDPGWHSAVDPVYPQIIHVEFQEQEVHSLELFPQTGNAKRAPNNIVINLSPNGKSWTTAALSTDSCKTKPNGWSEIKFTQAFKARFMDIVIFSNCGARDLVTLKGLRIR